MMAEIDKIHCFDLRFPFPTVNWPFALCPLPLWDNWWFGRNQIYLKLKLGAPQFMPGIKNLNLICVKKFFEFQTEVAKIKKNIFVNTLIFNF
jgi:hypothetical protein